VHAALEAAQAACGRAPKDAEAWWLLGRVCRHAAMPTASDDAFRRAAALGDRFAVPYRVPPERFLALIDEARTALTGDARRRLESTAIRTQPVPTVEQIRGGVDPDALTLRERVPRDVLVLFQVNHENRSGSEDALRALVRRSLTRA